MGEKISLVRNISQGHSDPSQNVTPNVGVENGNLGSEDKLNQCVDLLLTLQKELRVEREQRLKVEKRLLTVEQGGDLMMASEQDPVPNMPMQSKFMPGNMGHGVKPEVMVEMEHSNFQVGSDTGLLPNTSQEIGSMKLQILDLQSKLLQANIYQKSTEQQLSDLKLNFEHLSNQSQSYQPGENLADRLNQFHNRKDSMGAHEDGTCHKIDTDNQDYLT